MEKIIQNVLMDGCDCAMKIRKTTTEFRDGSHRSVGMSTTGDRESPSPSFVKILDANGHSAGRWLLYPLAADEIYSYRL
jgi:hypothetical protein